MNGLRSARFWISLLISALFLWLALRGQHLAETMRTLREADYGYLLPALVLYFVGVWVRAGRWKVLLSPMGSYSAGSLFPVVVIGYMANDVLPARMGEVVRVYVLAEREGLPRSSALGTVVVERLLDAVTMLLLLAVAALLVPLSGTVERIAIIAAGLVLVAVWPLVFLVLWPDQLARLVAPFAARLPQGLAGRLSGVAAGFLAGLRVVRSRRVLGLGLALSVVAWLFEAGMYWALAVGFGLPVGGAVVLLTLAVTNLATLVPSAPGYIGPFEAGALAVLVGLAGVSQELATAYVLALHAALVIPVTLLGFVYWGSHNLSLQRIRREAQVRRQRQPERSVKAHTLD